MEFDEPSYEDLKEQVSALELTSAQQLAVIAEQAATIADLQARLSDLEQRLRRNSRNSSMPPSAEGFAKPPAPNRAARRAAKRRPGKQPGSEGNHLAQVDNPDVVLLHAPNLCEGCGADLSTAEVLSTERRQVFDLPVVRAVVTEHQIERRRCSCGFETKAPAPREATAPACYGAGVRSLACYLARYDAIVTTGIRSNPPATRNGKAGRPARTKPANLAHRLDVQRDDVLRFALDFRAPFDNNQAERDIRMVKLQQKISGSWRTLTGARNYCALRSYISTIRKHNYDVLSGLRQLVEGQAWLPGAPE